MNGSVIEVEPGLWRVVVNVARDPATGKRRRAVRHVHGSQAAAEAVRGELLATVGSYRPPAPPRPPRRPAPGPERYDLAAALAHAEGITHGVLAEHVGVSRSAVVSWTQRGLDEYRADEVAIALGRHPAEVWPDW